MSDSSTSSHAEVPVVCSVCRTRLSAPSALIGKTIVCPDCRTVNRVTAPAPTPPPPKPKYTGDEYQLQEESAPPTPTVPLSDLVKVHCARCSTLMHARVEHVGRKLRCPDCGTTTVIPPPRTTPAPFQPPDARDVMLDAAPTPTADLKRKEIADRLMAEATQHVAKKEATKPKPPKHPMRSGIYSFLFYPTTIALWLIFGLGLTVCMLLWRFVGDVMNQGIASIMAAFVMPILSILTAGLLGLVAPHFLTVIEHTSDGHDRMPNWPAQDLLSRLRALWFWFNGLAISTAPGMVVVSLLRWTGLPIPNLFGLVSTMILFPIVVMSLLVNHSIFMFYSAPIVKTLSRHRTTWISFYAQTIGVAAGFVLLVVALLWAQNEPSVWLDAIVFLLFAMYAVVYCRLLGRLAYVFSRDPEIAHALAASQSDRDEDEPDEEEDEDDEEISSSTKELRSVTRPRQ